MGGRWYNSAMDKIHAIALATAFGALSLLHGGAAAAFAPITREEAAEERAVCVTGVVTCVAYWQKNSCVIASPDDVDGMAVYAAGEHPETGHTTIDGGEIRVGDVLEVSGRIVPMFFSPGIAAYRYVRLGRQALGPSPVRTLSDFSQGLLDNRRTRIEGVVAEVRPLTAGYSAFGLATRQGVVEARVRAPAEDVRRLSDAEVCVDGVAMSRYNHRAEFLGVRIEVDSLDMIDVKRPASEDPFSAKEVPLNAVMSWSPEGHDGHRRLVRGTVTASNPDGTFYMQKGDLAIRASTGAFGGAPEAGMAVDAVGFPEMIGGIGQLVGVIWRRSSAAPELPAPIEITDAAVTNLDYGADMTFRDYDCRLVSIKGRVYRIERNSSAFDMFLDIGGIGVGASVRGEVPDWLAREEEYGPMVDVTGIARLDTSRELANGHRPGMSSFSVEVPSSDGITLVPDGEWRARRRARALQKIAEAMSALLAALMAVGGWALWRARTRERESRLLADERKRMAGDLHDTIEQHLAGARILLSTAADKLGRDEPAAERAVKMAGEVLAEAKRQIRDVILNLRSDILMRESTESLVAKLAKDINARGIVRVRVRLRGIPSDLSAGEKSDLVAIVQQAVTNAVKHGGAKNIAIVSDPEGGAADSASLDSSRGKTGFVLRILNDGEPFDAAKALGPESGHFGLANMRERAKRSGMSIEWCREGKWMCVKIGMKERP